MTCGRVGNGDDNLSTIVFGSGSVADGPTIEPIIIDGWLENEKENET